MDALQKKKLLIDRINQGAKSLVFLSRFLVRLKGPESYLHLSPLNQTLVSCLRQKGEGFLRNLSKRSLSIFRF
ncbi:unnamed protein product [Brassica rapa subsp. narinosa]